MKSVTEIAKLNRRYENHVRKTKSEELAYRTKKRVEETKSKIEALVEKEKLEEKISQEILESIAQEEFVDLLKEIVFDQNQEIQEKYQDLIDIIKSDNPQLKKFHPNERRKFIERELQNLVKEIIENDREENRLISRLKEFNPDYKKMSDEALEFSIEIIMKEEKRIKKIRESHIELLEKGVLDENKFEEFVKNEYKKKYEANQQNEIETFSAAAKIDIQESSSKEERVSEENDLREDLVSTKGVPSNSVQVKDNEISQEDKLMEEEYSKMFFPLKSSSSVRKV
ncbi:MAG: LMBR1 domain-containing protein [Pelagibacterales bacterium]|nr:LMBR1 domain-containing protein [Pelagibacterales bacterium]